MLRVPIPAVLGLAMAILVLLLPGCGPGQSGVESLRVQVLATLPHDETMYTQGLEIADGVLYEGSGRVGQSRVRAMELSAPGSVLQETTLPAPLFGEGITVAGTRLWQLTWTDGMAIERDPETLAERRRVPYQGEGWGLCHDGDRLVMSDGSDRLTFRDPVTFARTGQVAVRLDGEPVRQLNELECAGAAVWANVYLTDRILRIDPATGSVTGEVDAAGLLSAPQRATADVLNGIAAIPGTDEFLITGKNWPALFRVRFVPS
ncbi:MAG: glutaminyl-peptide cyclotransferase [Pseudonocardiaceae bacterium]